MRHAVEPQNLCKLRGSMHGLLAGINHTIALDIYYGNYHSIF